jgi:colanic acid/amylovoran biosynthesis glycosyltransferase
MKIIYVTAGFPFGSEEAFLIPEFEELIAQGQEVLIVPMRPGREVCHHDAAKFVGRAIKAPLFSATILKDGALEFCRHFEASARAIRLFANSRSPELIWKNTAIIAKGLWLSGIARKWGADHIHAYWASSVASLALVAAESAGIAWSFTAHRHDIVQNNLLEEKARRAAFVRIISENGLRISCLAASGLTHKLAVLHLGIPIPPLPNSADRGGRPIVLCPANLIPVKGHRFLIEAVEMLRGASVDVELWLAGNGELRELLEKQVRDLDLYDRVRFLGHISHDDLIALYKNGEVDIVVLPSVDLGSGLHEGIPVALMEAMSYALPVVATKTGGIPELVGNGAGLLLEPADPRAIASALAKLAVNSELRKSVGLAGRKRVEQSFGITKQVKELVHKFGESGASQRTDGKSVQIRRSAESCYIPRLR